VIFTPAQLLLAIAEHETLEKTCAALPGLTRDAAQKLLRGAARQLQQEKLPLPETSAPVPGRIVRVYSDGAARGNPGPAGAGAVLTDSAGNVIARLGRFLGKQTNNVAEYEGLLLGLKHARELGYREVEVRADSQLLIRQLKGEYAVRHAGLKLLHAEALRLLRSFDRYDLRHVPREENTLADEMSNRAIDEEMA
jgi:ribonuclease HI